MGLEVWPEFHDSTFRVFLRISCSAATTDCRVFWIATTDSAICSIAKGFARYGCQLHAYVLMANHVHLLATPTAAGAVARMMQAVGRNYVARFNNRHERTGTLWEGRYKSCLVGTGSYVLACYRYIELNPVRARMVESPEHFPWSSYNCNAMGHMNALSTPHPCYQGLGQTAALRVEAYRAIVRESLPDAMLNPPVLAAAACTRRGCFPQHVRSQDPTIRGRSTRSPPTKTAAATDK